MKTRKKVLFLYTEIAEYFLAACNALTAHCEVYIVRWPVNNEAPFNFENSGNVHLIDRSNFENFELQNYVNELEPDVVICSGWMDKGYLKIVQDLSSNIPTVLSLDNHWKGSFRQRLASIVAQFTFLKNFKYVWVPGEKQVQFAKKLGFSPSEIFTGFYTANVERYNSAYINAKDKKTQKYPKQFLYLGRYVQHKGIFDLWSAFRNYKNNGGTWDLVCAGTGDQWNNRIESEGIFHKGFIQPVEIPALIENSGAYVLPSHEEPWGVSVHEMAAAGMPLLLCNRIGSIKTFLEEGQNGYSFDASSVDQIEQIFHKIESTANSDLLKMSALSHKKGNVINTETWVSTVLKILQK